MLFATITSSDQIQVVDMPRTGLEWTWTGLDMPRTGLEWIWTGLDMPRTGLEWMDMDWIGYRLERGCTGAETH